MSVEVSSISPRIRRIAIILLDALVRVFFASVPFPVNQRLERRITDLLKFGEEDALDERIKKIDIARDNLADALLAVDELKRNAEDNKAELALLQAALAKAAANKSDLSLHNQQLQKLAQINIDTIRVTLGIPTRQQVLRGYALSFVGGIAMTLALALVYDFAVKPVFLHFFPGLTS